MGFSLECRIAYVGMLGGNFDIYVMNGDGSNVVRLTNHEGTDQQPSWGPSGKIAFVSDRDIFDNIFAIKAPPKP